MDINLTGKFTDKYFNFHKNRKIYVDTIALRILSINIDTTALHTIVYVHRQLTGLTILEQRSTTF